MTILLFALSLNKVASTTIQLQLFKSTIVRISKKCKNFYLIFVLILLISQMYSWLI